MTQGVQLDKKNTLRSFADKWLFMVLALVLLFGFAVAVVRLISDSAMYTYEGDNFFISAPKEATVDVSSNITRFSVGPSRVNSQASASDDEAFLAALDSISNTFSASVACSERTADQDTIAKMDKEFGEGVVMISGHAITRFETTEIMGNPARLVGYENDMHQVVGVFVQSDRIVCMLAAYVPKDAPEWQSVAEQMIFSLKIK